MYAEAVRELPDGGLWTYEAKLDGEVALWSRRGNLFTARFFLLATLVPAR